MRSFDLGPGTSVRIADRELADEVNRYLNLIGSAKAVDLCRLTISAGTGEREIFVSYIGEVPVWKSTYRILLDPEHRDKPLVQGWAVVDNTIGEDWKDVQLSLVAGAPQSFVQNISQPMYVRRPEVPLPQSAMLTPQTHESAMNALAAPPPPAGSIVNAFALRPPPGYTPKVIQAKGNAAVVEFYQDMGLHLKQWAIYDLKSGRVTARYTYLPDEGLGYLGCFNKVGDLTFFGPGS